jgi:hypothetical protein
MEEPNMQNITQSYKGVTTLLSLNWDRFMTAGMMIFALYAGAYIALL